MTRVLAATCGLVACSRPVASTTPVADASTALEVVVLDDYSAREACDGVAPRQLELAIDGRPIGTVAIPCRTAIAMPPPQLAGPRLVLPPGTYTVTAREVGGTAHVEKQITLPALDDDERATQLPVWASDDELDVSAPKVRITFEGGD